MVGGIRGVALRSRPAPKNEGKHRSQRQDQQRNPKKPLSERIHVDDDRGLPGISMGVAAEERRGKERHLSGDVPLIPCPECLRALRRPLTEADLLRTVPDGYPMSELIEAPQQQCEHRHDPVGETPITELHASSRSD